MKIIKFHAKDGVSIKTNATETYMKGVEQVAEGGKIEHRATEELTQIGNTMEASENGQILNEVEVGKLNQIDNKMAATKGGSIVNKVSKNIKTISFIVLLGAAISIVGFWSDITSLADHYTQK